MQSRSYYNFLEVSGINPDSYVWLIEDNLPNKRAIYLYDYVIITTKAIYTLINDTDPYVRDEVGMSVELIDYTDISIMSIPSDVIRSTVLQYVEVSNTIFQ